MADIINQKQIQLKNVKTVDIAGDDHIVVFSSFGVNPDNIIEQYQPVYGNETANNFINCYTLSN
ncbi:hypothetical protein [Xenorhabdus bharatensis]|uniref:hypothetical protein n=1 Tax=Xenorhabdus bharatensis TaxID=3136256 RepID=UPI0030F42863